MAKSSMRAMSNSRRAAYNGSITRSTWHGTAFLVEALVLVAFIALSVAVFMQLFQEAHALGGQNQELGIAINAASNVAEEFAADPTAVSEVSQANGYTVHCDVDADDLAGGTLYHATIYVDDPAGGQAVYTINTARYVSEVE